MTSSCYVFVADGPEPRICGRYTVQDGIGHFVYGRSWLARPDAFPLDPINLPLLDVDFQFATLNGAIGVLADAAPDSWGRQVQRAHHRQQPANEVEWLLVGSGRGAGCLAFSLSRERIKPPGAPPDFRALADFIALADAVEAGDALDLGHHPEWERLLDYGSSMGGAKPKLLVRHDGREWLAKLNRRSDPIDIVRLEFATRELATRVGIDMPAMQLHTVGGRSVLLVERFDRDGERRRHYVSVHSLLNAGRVREDDARSTYSYGQVAELSRRLCDTPRHVAPALYRRMVFNALIGNTDDHARNHGFLKNRHNHNYELTPAFDVSPQPGGGGVHALGLGQAGRLATRDNLLSQARRFLLTGDDSRAEIGRQTALLADWRDVYARHGVREGEIRAVQGGVLALDVTGE